VTVPATGPASTPFTVSAAADTRPGFYSVPVTFAGLVGTALPPSALSLTVAQPGSPLWYYNNTGISDDSATTGADLDGGGWSYSAQALVAAGVKPGGQVSAGADAVPELGERPGPDRHVPVRDRADHVAGR
jgi:hypothetical protein